jgi:hypothetical protein
MELLLCNLKYTELWIFIFSAMLGFHLSLYFIKLPLRDLIKEALNGKRGAFWSHFWFYTVLLDFTKVFFFHKAIYT